MTPFIAAVIERLPRRASYALAAALLSAGAPLGLLVVRLVQASPRVLTMAAISQQVASDPLAFLYVTASTVTIFTIFGYVLGYQADQLAALSQTDALTGLANARGFFNHLESEIARARRYRHPLALLIVDLDGLKRLNDRLGHTAGDDAIREAGRVIRTTLRQSDTGARWGGDEFALLAPDTGRPEAIALAERVRTTVAARGRQWGITASVGVTIMSPDEQAHVDSATLMHVADTALYEAKAAGRNVVAFKSVSEAEAGRQPVRET